MRSPTRAARIAVLGAFGPSLVAFRGALLATLSSRGHEVVCAAADLDSSVERELRRLGVRRCANIPIARAAISPIGDGRTLWSLRAWLAREAPDVLIAYTAKPVIYSGLVVRGAPRPAFFPLITGLGHAFIDEGSARRRALASSVARLYRAGLRRARTTCFQNPDDEREFRARGILRPDQASAIVSGSGVDLAAYPAAPPPADEGAPRFVFIGRLLREKGVVELVEAARALRRRRPEIRIAIVGGADANPSSLSLAQIRALHREGVVDYLGKTSDVRPHLEAASAFVLPSYREGLPRAALEAMATARPVITTDVPGCRHAVVHGESGLLVPPRDSAALARAIEDLADMPLRRAEMGRRARARAESHFDVHHVNDSLIHTLGLGSAGGPAPAESARRTSAAVQPA